MHILTHHMYMHIYIYGIYLRGGEAASEAYAFAKRRNVLGRLAEVGK